MMNDSLAEAEKYQPAKTQVIINNNTSELTPAYEDKEGYWNYFNNKYGFSLNYPKSYSCSNPIGNGIGIQFFSPDGKVVVTVYGNNVDDKSVLQYQYY